MTTLKPSTSIAAALKTERDRDKAQAMKDYQVEARAKHANMMRLRALRLASESAAASSPVRRLVERKTVTRKTSPTRTRVKRRAVP